MFPSPAELKYFMEVAKTLNLSRAAERLGVSQPTLTLAMRRLEDSLGQSILVRSKSGVKLTRGGDRLLNRARVLLEEWEQIKADTSLDEVELRGNYSIGCHPSVALYTVPTFAAKLLKENKYLELRFVHDLSRKITEGVISSKIDFGLVVNPVAHPDLVIRPLLKDEVTFWASGDYGKVNEKELVLICDQELNQTQTLIRQVIKKGIKISRIIESSNLEVITHLVATGAGIGIIPGRVATKNSSLNLRKVSASWPMYQDKICLIYRADSQKSHASREMARMIAASINNDLKH